jgi:Asp-tRNA(Asn)/Glu-tRNA(Gln) amidotransferase A subunit family amidase
VGGQESEGDSVISRVRDAVVSGTVSAEEVVAVALDRIQRFDPALNAVVALRAEEALAEARAADHARRNGEAVGPLEGVPVLVKDLEDVAGMRTTQGSVIFADAPPAKVDGLVPGRLRTAGAIVVGKTNLPEFACEGFTTNLLFGTTRNPWSLDWTPGGSSGGSAAVVAAGIVPIATATDGGGSIRIPAAFCGLVGIKPTGGVVGRRPIPDWIDFSTDGPFATTVADLRLLLSVEGGPVAGDPTALPVTDLSSGGRPGKVFATPRLSPAGPLPDEIAAMFERAVASFAEMLGMEIERIEPESLWTAGKPDDDWYVMATAEHVHRFGRDFVEANLDRMHASARSFLGFGLGVAIDDYIAARRRRFEYVRELDELLGRDGIILTPTVAAAGFLADGRMSAEDEPGTVPNDVYNTGTTNITGHPSISLPAGICRNGVPFGLQVTGPRFRDGLLLELAQAWEQSHAWPLVAPGHDPFDAALGLV